MNRIEELKNAIAATKIARNLLDSHTIKDADDLLEDRREHDAHNALWSAAIDARNSIFADCEEMALEAYRAGDAISQEQIDFLMAWGDFQGIESGHQKYAESKLRKLESQKGEAL